MAPNNPSLRVSLQCPCPLRGLPRNARCTPPGRLRQRSGCNYKGGGGDTKQKIYRNFGYARPEGYRKALRAMKLAEKFGRAVIAFIAPPPYGVRMR